MAGSELPCDPPAMRRCLSTPRPNVSRHARLIAQLAAASTLACAGADPQGPPSTGSSASPTSEPDSGTTTAGPTAPSATSTGEAPTTATPELTTDNTTNSNTTTTAAPSTSTGETTATNDSGIDPADALHWIDFDDAPLGPYSEDSLAAAWQDPAWNQGIDEGRVEVFAGEDAYAGRSLRVHYPQGGVGPADGGAQWQLVFTASHTELYCAYRLRFAPGFDFVKGGKLPGLAGGAANTGGDKPTGSDGWSARMMWRADGEIVQYTYHVDQPTDYGEDMQWDLGGKRHFVPGQWHRLEHRVVMNTPGEHDGVLEGWLDGEQVFIREGLRFRDVDSFAVDLFYFSTFFGGSGDDWAPSQAEYVDFDEFIVATTPIGH